MCGFHEQGLRDLERMVVNPEVSRGLEGVGEAFTLPSLLRYCPQARQCGILMFFVGKDLKP